MKAVLSSDCCIGDTRWQEHAMTSIIRLSVLTDYISISFPFLKMPEIGWDYFELLLIWIGFDVQYMTNIPSIRTNTIHAHTFMGHHYDAKK